MRDDPVRTAAADRNGEARTRWSVAARVRLAAALVLCVAAVTLRLTAFRGDVADGPSQPAPEPTAQSQGDNAATGAAVHVRIVDADGRPCAGVGAWLQKALPGTKPRRAGFARTGSDGIAAIRDREPAVPGAYLVRVEVAADVRANVSLATSAGNPLQIALPPLGSLRVRALDASGAPLAGARIWLHPREPSDAIVVRADTDAEGIARFERVAIGLRASVSVGLPRNRSVDPAIVTGPSAAGEQRTETVVVGARDLVFTGRVLRSDGRPVAGLELSLYTLSPKGRMGEGLAQGKTDAAGRYRVPFELPTTESRGWYVEIFADSLARSPIAFRPLPEAVRPGDVPLPDIVLPVLAAGTVTDESGRGLAGVLVELEEPGGVCATTDARGAYELLGPEGYEPESLDVTCSLDGWHLAARDGFALRMARSGSIVVELAASPELPAWFFESALRVEVTSGAQRSTSAGGSRHSFDARGRLEVGGLRRGSVGVRIELEGTTLLEVPDVRVEAGKRTRDPRLVGAAIGPRLRSVPVTVTDSAGRPLADASVAWTSSDRLDWLGPAATGADGVARLLRADLRANERVQICVAKRGHRTVVLDTPLPANVRLGLPLFAVVRVRLARHTGEFARIGLVAEIEPSRPVLRLSQRARFDDGGVARFVVDDPGEYRVRVVREGRALREPSLATEPANLFVTVPPGGATTTVDVLLVE